MSPLLANVYLHRLDRAWDVTGRGVLVRYADDLVVLCRSREEAEAALALLRDLLGELGLELKAEKTRIVHLADDRSEHLVAALAPGPGLGVRDVRAPTGVSVHDKHDQHDRHAPWDGLARSSHRRPSGPRKQRGAGQFGSVA